MVTTTIGAPAAVLLPDGRTQIVNYKATRTDMSLTSSRRNRLLTKFQKVQFTELLMHQHTKLRPFHPIKSLLL